MYATGEDRASSLRVWTRIEQAVLAQLGWWFLWCPIGLAIGITAYFAISFEPDIGLLAGIACVACVCLLAARVGPEAMIPFGIGSTVILTGFLVAAWRTHSVAHPVLSFRYYGPVEGRIVAMDRSFSDKLRLTLDEVWLEDMRPERIPARVRVALHGQVAGTVPVPGQRVMLTANLSPPAGPVEPGGFDFRRHAWFQELGAVGYTRAPVMQRAPPEHSSSLAVFRFRMTASAHVRAVLPSESGALAAAVLTGDRSGISQPVLESLRASNLAHLLAISGMHMGMLTGVVFTFIRILIACVPWLALRVSSKKVAAVTALGAGAMYLMMSGGAVSTQRAFIMVSVMLCAILLGKRAISLRAVAIAAVIVLVLTPEALLGPGFQMSFAATTALVAVFGYLRDAEWWGKMRPKWLRGVAALVVSSAVAGATTAPFAAAHFNRIADYGLLANLLSVPVMGTVVMPGAVLSAVLAPIGLDALGLYIMDLGVRWILFVASWVAGMPGAVTWVVAPPAWVLGALAFGSLVCILWQGQGRWIGLAGPVCAVLGWMQAERPDVLISATGGLIGLKTEAGRALSKPKGDGFSARSWLENDGDGGTQAEAAGRIGFEGEGGKREIFAMSHTPIIHLTGKRGAAQLPLTCNGEIFVLNTKLSAAPQGACLIFDQTKLRDSGAVSITWDTTGPKLRFAKDPARGRLWGQ